MGSAGVRPTFSDRSSGVERDKTRRRISGQVGKVKKGTGRLLTTVPAR